MTTLSHHGVCVSYNTVKRIDVDLAEQIIATAGDIRVPLPTVLEETSLMNGALDTFDHNESTLAGTGSTHDTVLVLFQNVPINLEKPPEQSEISTKSLAAQSLTTVKLRSQVSCQQLVRMGPVKERGEIPTYYKVSETPFNSADDPTTVSTTAAAAVDVVDIMLQDTPHTTTDSYAMATDFAGSTKSINSDNFLRIVNCSSRRDAHESDYVPGFTAVRSATGNCNFHPTTTILTPIVPYPATTYDAILTMMINFQDVLKRKGDPYGGLWAHEGVYRIAKEIELMRPDQFSDIFLGLGGFHMEKIVLACLGTYLEPFGIFAVLVESECYGTNVIKTVISGSHYSKARTAHSMLHEVLTSMMLEAFLSK